MQLVLPYSSTQLLPLKFKLNPKSNSGMTSLTSSKKIFQMLSMTLVTGLLPTSLISGRRTLLIFLRRTSLIGGKRTSWISGQKILLEHLRTSVIGSLVISPTGGKKILLASGLIFMDISMKDLYGFLTRLWGNVGQIRKKLMR